MTNSAVAFRATARDLRPTKSEIRDYLRGLPAKEIESLIDAPEPVDDAESVYETIWAVWRIDNGSTEWLVARDEAEAIELSRRNWTEALGEARGDFTEPDLVERLPPGKSLTLGLVDGRGPGITATAAAWSSVFLGPYWLGGSEY